MAKRHVGVGVADHEHGEIADEQHRGACADHGGGGGADRRHPRPDGELLRQRAIQRLPRCGDVPDHADADRPQEQGKRRGDAEPHAEHPHPKPARDRDEHDGAGEKQTERVKRPDPPGNWRLVSHRPRKYTVSLPPAVRRRLDVGQSSSAIGANIRQTRDVFCLSPVYRRHLLWLPCVCSAISARSAFNVVAGGTAPALSRRCAAQQSSPLHWRRCCALPFRRHSIAHKAKPRPRQRRRLPRVPAGSPLKWR